MRIHPHGFWDCTSGRGVHIHDPSLADALVLLLKRERNIETVADFGCGTGEYVHHFLRQGFRCKAYDGNPNTPALTNGVGEVVDLAKPFDLGMQFDCVMSLEVAEHIPQQYETVFLDNLFKHAKDLIVLSWAVQGQKGDGHVNCQNNDYVIAKMEQRGFVHDKINSDTLRKSPCAAPWFRKTLFVFRRAVA